MAERRSPRLSRRSLIVGGVAATAGALVPLVRTFTSAEALPDGPPLPEPPELDLRTVPGKRRTDRTQFQSVLGRPCEKPDSVAADKHSSHR
ncbi:hypothetical protein ACIF8T_25925 [Streptomyces sp. NPDC085946]|uniref:hypothetical protein n=1 Tax=Streptomyces sp. NPDC085946 TaxID=3365744 RepID=UPI0037D3E904